MAHQDELERVARAIEATMFAPHELPLPAELHAKYLETARAAIVAQKDARLWACTGCGTMKSIEQIRGEHPEALSCCPERKMAPQHNAIDEQSPASG